MPSLSSRASAVVAPAAAVEQAPRDEEAEGADVDAVLVGVGVGRRQVREHESRRGSVGHLPGEVGDHALQLGGRRSGERLVGGERAARLLQGSAEAPRRLLADRGRDELLGLDALRELVADPDRVDAAVEQRALVALGQCRATAQRRHLAALRRRDVAGQLAPERTAGRHHAHDRAVRQESRPI
jgi:hypothetical protein